VQSADIDSHHPEWRPLPYPVSFAQAALALLSPPSYTGSAEYAEAWTNIQAAATLPKTWDLILKIFNDFDKFLFHGELRSRFRVRFEDFPVHPGYLTPPFAVTKTYPDNPPKRIEIIFDRRTDWSHRSRNAVQGTLSHKMLHAYFYIRCRTTDEISCGMGQGHCRGYWWTLAAMGIEFSTGFWLFVRDNLAPMKLQDYGKGWWDYTPLAYGENGVDAGACGAFLALETPQIPFEATLADLDPSWAPGGRITGMEALNIYCAASSLLFYGRSLAGAAW